MTYQVGIYDRSHLIAVVEGEPSVAWRAAQAYVRGMAHADGVEGEPSWYRSGQRECYQRGIYHALPMSAPRRTP